MLWIQAFDPGSPRYQVITYSIVRFFSQGDPGSRFCVDNVRWPGITDPNGVLALTFDVSRLTIDD
jgi:hypothetical protein